MNGDNTTMKAIGAFALAAVCVIIAIVIFSFTLGGGDTPRDVIPAEVDEVIPAS